jgi:hypothetical protein
LTYRRDDFSQLKRSGIFLVIGLLSLLHAPLYGQDDNAYSFLDVPASSRLAALGGYNVSHRDRDVNFFYSNPALLGDTLAGVAAASYQFYVADIGHASFSYAHKFRRLGVIGFGVQHLGYGTIKSYDATGQEIGDFNAGSSALLISKSHTINNFRMGATLKMAFSNLAGFRSSAAMIDVGGIFIHPKKQITVGITLKNIGVVLQEYSETSDTKLPFDVQVGATLKPEHMPFRFSLTAYNLTDRDNSSNLGITTSGLGKVFRHLNFGGELLLHRNFNILLGYNYGIHQQLKLDEGGGIAGVSMGLLLRIKAFEVVVSRSTYVIGNAGYGFTLSANVEKIITR